MRPSAAALGGGEWGSMSHQSGIHTFGISGFQQRAFKGFFSKGAGKLVRRWGKNVPFILPPVLGYLALSDWMEKKYEYYNRKEYKMLHPHEH